MKKLKMTLPTVEHQWKTNDGLNLVGQSWSVDSPRGLIVIVHGTGDHLGRFEWLVKQFNDCGYSVFGADFRGNGRSEGTRGYAPSFDVLVEDLAMMISIGKEVCDVPVFLYGQSMGGLLSIYFSMKDPGKLAGVVASSPALGLAIKAPRWKLAVGRTLGTLNPKMSLASGIKLQQLSRVPERLAEFQKDELRHRRMCARTFFSMLDTMSWCHEHASEIDLPALVIHGEADTITDPLASQRFAKRANSDFKMWPEMLHELHQDVGREKVFSFVAQWLNEVLQQNPSRLGAD